MPGGTCSGRVYPKGIGGGHLEKDKHMRYKRVEDIIRTGPCLVPGHPKEHVLEARCWQAMRHFLYDNKDDFAAYIQAVKNK